MGSHCIVTITESRDATLCTYAGASEYKDGAAYWDGSTELQGFGESHSFDKVFLLRRERGI